MLNKLELNNFRNFKLKRFEFSPGTTVIVGPNASGKTNILESIILLSLGKSFKAKVEEEMVNYDEEIGRVRAKIKDDELGVVLTRGAINIGTTAEEKTPRKKLIINGISKRLIDFSGTLKTVLFSPQDMDLITESPSIRRKFLDSVLSQVDREYRRALLSYEKGLRRRNKLLYKIREEGISRNNLLFWNKLLIKNGDYISTKRQEFLDFVNETEGLNNEEFKVEYDRSAISEGRLDQYKNEEVAAATTLVGPHRDDFSTKIILNKKLRDLDKYGSRGEQRMGVLWIKLAELKFIKDQTGEKPTLLLDDIFSELDHNHRDIVMKYTKNQQTIITTADEHFIKNFGKINVINLK